MSKRKTRDLYRDARTGRITTKRFAELHPDITVKERIKLKR